MRALVKEWIKAHSVELLLFLFLWTTYAYFYQSTQDNEGARLDQVRTIVEDRTLAINKHWWNTADIIHYQKDGSDHIYPNKAPGATLLGIVPWIFSSILLFPVRAAGLPDWICWHLQIYLTTVLSVSLLSSLAAVALCRILIRITDDRYFSVLTVLAIWLGTLVFPFSTLFFGHQFAAALLVFAFYFLFQTGHVELSWRKSIIYLGVAGVLMGLSIATEYPTALLVFLLSVYAIWIVARLKYPLGQRASLAGCLAIGLLLGVGFLLVYNLIAFGKLFYVPYESYTKPGAYFNATYSQGWLGLHPINLQQFLHALAAITIFPPIGILYIGVQGWRVYACNPVLWLAAPGLAIMIWKRETRPEGLLILAMTTVFVFFITSYGKSVYDWSGASYLGPRHIIPLLPFLALPLYFGARKLRFVFYPLLAISVFYMLLATAIEPRVPTPFQIPARDFLLPDYLRGKLAQNPRSMFDGAHRNLTRDSTAFNLAKIAGIPGRYQLAPLMVWWLAIAGLLMSAAAASNRPDFAIDRPVRRTRYSPSRAATVVAIYVGAIALMPIFHHAIASSGNKEHGLLGKYYRNANWIGEPNDVQVDSVIDFDWSRSFPLPPPFSVEWTGNMIIEQPNNYTFSLVADDGAQLEVDGRVVVDVLHSLLQERSGSVYLTKGLHSIRVRYLNVMFGGSVRLWWTESGRPKQIIPVEVLVPAAQNPKPSR